MSSQIAQIRFVYCPRCQQLLKELPNIPVYKCGRCGAVLQAKYCRDGGECRASTAIEKTPEINEGEKIEDEISNTSNDKRILSQKDSNVAELNHTRKSDVVSSSEVSSHEHPVEEKEEKYSTNDGESVASNNQERFSPKHTYLFDMECEKGKLELADYDNKLPESKENSCTISSKNELSSRRKDSQESKQREEWKQQTDSNSKSNKSSTQPTLIERELAFTTQKLMDVHTTRLNMENYNMNEKLQHHYHGNFDHTISGNRIERTVKSVSNSNLAEDGIVDTQINGNNNQDFLESQINRRSQAYDASVSSNGDDYDEHLLPQHCSVPGRTSVKPKRVRGSFSRGGKASAALSNESHDSGYTERNNWNGHEPSKSQKYAFKGLEQQNLRESDIFKSVWNWMDSESGLHGSPLRREHYQRDSANFYHDKCGCMANYGHEDPLHSPNSIVSDKLNYLEHDRLKLLREIDELREKLSRSFGEREKTSRRFPICHTQKGSHWPLHYHNRSSQELQCCSPSYPCHYPQTYTPRNGRSSPILFADHAGNYNYPVGSSNMQFYPEDQKYPSKFQSCICYDKGLCGACGSYTGIHSPISASSMQLTEYSIHETEMPLCQVKKLPRKCRFLQPVAGGAPFVICKYCRKLLQLPADFLLPTSKRHKLQCGACSKVLTFWLLKKTPFIHFGTSSQEPYDDNNIMRVPKYPKSNLQNPRQLRGSVFPSHDAADSVETPLNTSVTTPASASPLHRLMGYSSPCEIINGSKVGDHEHDARGDQPTQNSFDTSIENRMSLPHFYDLESKSLPSYNEISEEDLPENSSPQSTIKKGPIDFKPEWGTTKQMVIVNGRVIPNHLVAKAEERAGPIQPGKYWYDLIAGFWGIMGQPCLGIIPPFLEEFNFPMKRECSGGNTGIIVNGRELHKEDLDLLSYRGLPTTKNGSYIVKANGQVIDEESGAELGSLGKLAPTVEKLGHGFGMHIPDF